MVSTKSHSFLSVRLRCVRLFPTHGLELIHSLLLHSIERLNNSLNEALMKFASIELTMSIQKTSFEFLSSINEVLSSSLQNNTIKKSTFKPIENQVEKSVQIERSNLNRLINQLDLTSQSKSDELIVYPFVV